MALAERLGPGDEKVTVNVGPVDLGKIDLLVSEGFYAGRSDFIRLALRNQLGQHDEIVDQVVTRKEFTVGFLLHGASDLERFRQKGVRLKVRVVGVYKLGGGVTPELAEAVLEDVVVHGALRGPKEVVERIKSRRSASKEQS